MKVFNNLITKARRKVLRTNQTEAEKKLWARLRNKQLFGYKIYRQYGVGKYIADFYCPSLKLVIEVDGGQHFEEKGLIKDKKREEYFAQVHITVVRFSNSDVLTNINGVLEELIKRTPPAPL
jgi:very-short-patch-repair endonuclease